MSAHGAERRLRRVAGPSARLARSQVVTMFTMVFSPAQLASISPKTSPPDRKKTVVVDGRYLANIAHDPRRHDHRRRVDPSISRPGMCNSAIRHRLDPGNDVAPRRTASETSSSREDRTPLHFFQAANVRDISLHPLGREGTIQISFASTAIRGAQRLTARHSGS